MAELPGKNRTKKMDKKDYMGAVIGRLPVGGPDKNMITSL